MRRRWIDLQDVRWFQAPDVSKAPQPPTGDSPEVSAQVAAERERAARRRGRSATIIAGLNQRTGVRQKELLGA